MDSVMQEFSAAETADLTQFARQQGLTLNALFQATWAVLLARYTNETDVTFGMITSGRTALVPQIESIIGLFINTLPFRVDLEANPTAADLLQQVAQTQFELQQREHTSLVTAQRWSGIPAGTNLFQTLLLFQNTPQTADEASDQGGLQLTRSRWVEPGGTAIRL